MAKIKDLLLAKYFNQGWLERKYVNGICYCQPYSSDDRLLSGRLFYNDYLCWQNKQRLVSNLEEVYVDKSFSSQPTLGFEAERFRKALRSISKCYLPIIYKIVLEEKEVKASTKMTARERLYFNDEIKGLLCRGLDELCAFYKKTGAY